MGKYGPEKLPNLDIFHAVDRISASQFFAIFKLIFRMDIP